MTRRAACSCGQLHLTIEGEPSRISMCHCLECQRRTGAVISNQARFPREQVTIAGKATAWGKLRRSGNGTRHDRRGTPHQRRDLLAVILDSVGGVTGFELPEDDSSNSHQLPKKGPTTLE